MFKFLQRNKRRKMLTDRLRRFTEVSATLPATRPTTPKPEAPAAPDVGTLETFEAVNNSGIWGFNYAGWTAR